MSEADRAPRTRRRVQRPALYALLCTGAVAACAWAVLSLAHS